MSITTSDLTISERVVILRRREEQKQENFAARFGMTTHQLSAVECGDTAPNKVLQKAAMRLGQHKRLETHEACFIARRRAGVSQQQVAKDLGRCRYWVNRMELGLVPCHELADYWF